MTSKRFLSHLNPYLPPMITMNRFKCVAFAFSFLLSLGMFSGCGKPEPTVIEQPVLTPEEAAAKEAAYDKSMMTDS